MAKRLQEQERKAEVVGYESLIEEVVNARGDERQKIAYRGWQKAEAELATPEINNNLSRLAELRAISNWFRDMLDSEGEDDRRVALRVKTMKEYETMKGSGKSPESSRRFLDQLLAVEDGERKYVLLDFWLLDFNDCGVYYAKPSDWVRAFKEYLKLNFSFGNSWADEIDLTGSGPYLSVLERLGVLDLVADFYFDNGIRKGDINLVKKHYRQGHKDTRIGVFYSGSQIQIKFDHYGFSYPTRPGLPEYNALGYKYIQIYLDIKDKDIITKDGRFRALFEKPVLHINDKLVGVDGTLANLFAQALNNPKSFDYNNQRTVDEAEQELRQPYIEEARALIESERSRIETELRERGRILEQNNLARNDRDGENQLAAIEQRVKDEVQKILSNVEQGGDRWSGEGRLIPQGNGQYRVIGTGQGDLLIYPIGNGQFRITKWFNP